VPARRLITPGSTTNFGSDDLGLAGPACRCRRQQV